MPEAGDPRGKEATGTVEEELRDTLEYYHELADESGEIALPPEPVGASAAYRDACRELG